MTIERNPARLAVESWDVVIVGGGIYGAMLLNLAARRGLKSLLIERGDFGAATSFNSLRIVHGGLRYLQSLDLRRSTAMIRERAWYLENFPDLVRPMPCLMPLYNRGLRHTSALRVALSVDNALNRSANRRLQVDQRIRRGRVIGADAVRNIFPAVRGEGLRGGAVWYDAQVPDSPRLIMEVLRWAASAGASALNYTEATELIEEGGAVRAVRVLDRVSGSALEYRTKVLINAAGSQCRSLAARFDRDLEDLFRPSLAWNVLFDRDSVSDHALAVSGESSKAQVYFLVPWHGRLLAGTGHAALGDDDRPSIEQSHIEETINDLNKAAPDLALRFQDVSRVFRGLLPVRRRRSVDLATREVIYDHGRHEGPEGLISVSGVKLVAAHQVAARAVRLLGKRFFPARTGAPSADFPRPEPAKHWDIVGFVEKQADLESYRHDLRRLVDEESVVHLDDLVYRRTNLWQLRRGLEPALESIVSLFPWDPERRETELRRMKSLMEEVDQGTLPLPAEPAQHSEDELPGQQ